MPSKLEIKIRIGAPSTARVTAIAKSLGLAASSNYEDSEANAIVAVAELMSGGLTLVDAIAVFKRQNTPSPAMSDGRVPQEKATSGMTTIQTQMAQMLAPVALEAATQSYEAFWLGVAQMSGHPAVTESERGLQAREMAEASWATPWACSSSQILDAMLVQPGFLALPPAEAESSDSFLNNNEHEQNFG